MPSCSPPCWRSFRRAPARRPRSRAASRSRKPPRPPSSTSATKSSPKASSSRRIHRSPPCFSPAPFRNPPRRRSPGSFKRTSRSSPRCCPCKPARRSSSPTSTTSITIFFPTRPPKRFALGRFRYSTELKNAPLSSRPASWTRGQQWWTYPAVAARLGYAPNPLWAFGVSASTGTYLRPSAGLTLAPGLGRGDYRQRVVAADVALAWRHWQVWAELYRTRFALPRIGDADTLAGYVEAKYKFTPQLFGAVRWNRQILGTIPDGPRGPVQWGRDVSRLDLAPGYRFTPHVKLKLQDTWQAEPAAAPARTETHAPQLTVRFGAQPGNNPGTFSGFRPAPSLP